MIIQRLFSSVIQEDFDDWVKNKLGDWVEGEDWDDTFYRLTDKTKEQMADILKNKISEIQDAILKYEGSNLLTQFKITNSEFKKKSRIFSVELSNNSLSKRAEMECYVEFPGLDYFWYLPITIEENGRYIIEDSDVSAAARK